MNDRLQAYLEQNNLLSPTLTGIKAQNSNSNSIENGFQEKNKIAVVFVDMTKAFDTV